MIWRDRPSFLSRYRGIDLLKELTIEMALLIQMGSQGVNYQTHCYQLFEEVAQE